MAARTGRAFWRRAGIAAVATGLVMAVSGIAVQQAGAEHDIDGRTVVCHRTKSTNHPYVYIEVATDAGDSPGQHDDHTSHVTGVVFEEGMAPGAWGDIIESHDNTAAEQAFIDNECLRPDEDPEDPRDPCPFDPDLFADDKDCVPPPGCVASEANNQCVPCPAGETPNGSGGCIPPPPPPPPPAPAPAECVATAENNQCTPCPDDAPIPDGTGFCDEEDLILPAAGSPPATVGGVVVTQPAPQALPRTGSEAVALLQIGLGLIVMGAGAMLFGRDRLVLI